MKKILAFLLAVLCMTCSAVQTAFAAPLPQNTVVATTYAQIQSAVGKDTAGAAVAVLVDGELLVQEGFGYADRTAKRLVTSETVFEIGRISSLFVALSAYRLAEMGSFSLTENITKYLPAHVVEALALSHPVTAEQLLLGCGGFEGRSFDLRFSKDDYRFGSLEEALLAQVPRQIAVPGSFYADSPFGIALVAYAIECVAQTSYEEFARKQILEPLGLKNTVLDPTADTALEDAALAYVASDGGSFALVAESGRTYGGLYPYDGALSGVGDLTRVMELLLYGNTAVLSEESRAALLQSSFSKGVFTLSHPAMAACGGAVGCNAKTDFFGASLWLDVANGRGAVVLTNTADSVLTALPQELFGGIVGVSVQKKSDGLFDVEDLSGFYAHAAGEGNSLVGRLQRKEQNIEIVANDDGTLSLSELRLVQIAPGIFADANGDDTVAVVQFLLDESGEVAQIVTAWGDTYLPVGFLENGTVSNALFWLMILLSVGFLLVGIWSLLRYIATVNERDRRGFVYTLPLLLTALIGACSLLQVFVAMQYAGRSFASFFDAMAVIVLLLCIGATFAFVLAFASSLTRRKMTRRVVRTSILFLLYLGLLWCWGIIIL